MFDSITVDLSRKEIETLISAKCRTEFDREVESVTFTIEVPQGLTRASVKMGKKIVRGNFSGRD